VSNKAPIYLSQFLTLHTSNPEDGSSVFLRNSDISQQDCDMNNHQIKISEFIFFFNVGEN
jgi:hypothetical protein